VSLISQPSQGHPLVMMTTPAKIPPGGGFHGRAFHNSSTAPPGVYSLWSRTPGP
jgi:hypothetical protein